jgi:putative PepSY-like beta-lactamase-inhibitor
MKEIFLAAMTCIAIVVSASGQKLKESQVPAVVKSSFQKQHPTVSASWEKEGANYEVNFKQDGKSMSSVIDKNGTILETETDIAIKDLPQAAQDYLKGHYKGVKIEEASRIVKSNGEVNFEAMVKGKDLIFDLNGKFLKTAKE